MSGADNSALVSWIWRWRGTIPEELSFQNLESTEHCGEHGTLGGVWPMQRKKRIWCVQLWGNERLRRVGRHGVYDPQWRVREVYSHAQWQNWKATWGQCRHRKRWKWGQVSTLNLKLYIQLDLFHIFHKDVSKIPQIEHFQDQIWSSSFHMSKWQDSVQLHEVEIKAQTLIPSPSLPLTIWSVTKTRRSDSLSNSSVSPLFSIPLSCAANHHHNPSCRIHNDLRKWANHWPHP